jgi:hypothetical protein
MARRHYMIAVPFTLDEDTCVHSRITDPEGHTDLDDRLDALRTSLDLNIEAILARYSIDVGEIRITHQGVTYEPAKAVEPL